MKLIAALLVANMMVLVAVWVTVLSNRAVLFENRTERHQQIEALRSELKDTFQQRDLIRDRNFQKIDNVLDGLLHEIDAIDSKLAHHPTTKPGN